ncbi:hypothetical protein HGRIS_002671 [Hohenbuehelia grisea]|uniref:Amidohydrolase-related domain-containing protein n=1 Tax=Hohenbuehelia grisea TaxID=104357 RepID=A0ABR3JN29_9AGAR
MDKLPVYTTDGPPQRPKSNRARLFRLLAFLSLAVSLTTFTSFASWEGHEAAVVPKNAAVILQKCPGLDLKPAPPPDFNKRTTSDRYEAGTPPVLIKNATVWTGRVSGLEIIKGDVLLDKGLIKAIGTVKERDLADLDGLVTVDAQGSWVTPGIVDMHSHLGVDSVPLLRGASDTNSLKGLVQPWLRSLDGLNTHDEAYQLSISGGVTTANVLPGSANSIGGQAFSIKLRPTKERSSSSMLLEPPFTLNGTEVDPDQPPRWRQMKHACGMNVILDVTYLVPNI